MGDIWSNKVDRNRVLARLDCVTVVNQKNKTSPYSELLCFAGHIAAWGRITFGGISELKLKHTKSAYIQTDVTHFEFNFTWGSLPCLPSTIEPKNCVLKAISCCQQHIRCLFHAATHGKTQQWALLSTPQCPPPLAPCIFCRFSGFI